MSESSVKKFQQKMRRKEKDRQDIVSAFMLSTRYWKLRHRVKLAWAIVFKAWGLKKKKGVKAKRS